MIIFSLKNNIFYLTNLLEISNKLAFNIKTGVITFYFKDFLRIPEMPIFRIYELIFYLSILLFQIKVYLFT